MTNLYDNELFTWDFTPIIREEKLLGILFLNANKELTKTEEHHFHSKVGLAETKDLIDIKYIKNDVLTAEPNSWDNTSIWSNDIIWHNGKWFLFYTSRDGTIGDGFTQSIGLSISDNLTEWKKIRDFKIDADSKWYETETLQGDPTIHAWRDPYIFSYKGDFFMLLTAKDRTKEIGKNGCIAILKATDESLLNWETLPPLISPELFSEMEEAEIFLNSKKELVITFSSWEKYDLSGNGGGLLSINIGTDLFNPKIKEIKSLCPESNGIYAAHVVPETKGAEIFGFDINEGGVKRSHIFTDFIRI